MNNVIQFPRFAPQTTAIIQATPDHPQAFYLRDRVRLSSGEEGFIYDGKPNFGLKKRRIYYVLITKGERPGISKACFEENMTLILGGAA